MLNTINDFVDAFYQIHADAKSDIKKFFSKNDFLQKINENKWDEFFIFLFNRKEATHFFQWCCSVKHLQQLNALSPLQRKEKLEKIKEAIKTVQEYSQLLQPLYIEFWENRIINLFAEKMVLSEIEELTLKNTLQDLWHADEISLCRKRTDKEALASQSSASYFKNIMKIQTLAAVATKLAGIDLPVAFLMTAYSAFNYMLSASTNYFKIPSFTVPATLNETMFSALIEKCGGAHAALQHLIMTTKKYKEAVEDAESMNTGLRATVSAALVYPVQSIAENSWWLSLLACLLLAQLTKRILPQVDMCTDDHPMQIVLEDLQAEEKPSSYWAIGGWFR